MEASFRIGESVIKNKIEIENDVYKITVAKKNGDVLIVLIDEADLPKLNEYTNLVTNKEGYHTNGDQVVKEES